MTHGRPRHLMLASLPFAALVLGTAALAAQVPQPRTAVSGGFIRADTAPTNRVSLTVQQVRALMIAHHRDVAAGTSEDNMVTFILASNGDYVASGTSKATAVAGFVGAANTTDTVRAVAVARGGQAVARLSPTTAATVDGPRMMTFAGIGEVDARLVQQMYVKSYEPGEVSMNAIRVRVVTLTGNVVR